MEKFWVGNRASVWKTLGATSHSKGERHHQDFYCTHPSAAEWLLKLEDLGDILEPACGMGHLSEVFRKAGKRVTSTDLFPHGYGTTPVDFFSFTDWPGDIVTNPPYKLALRFIEHALRIVHDGRKVAMFLKIQFLEGKKRKEFYLKNPPRTVYVSSSRIICSKGGRFKDVSSSAVAYGWFVWVKGFKGDPVLKWFN